jgi:hypothetical protein
MRHGRSLPKIRLSRTLKITNLGVGLLLLLTATFSLGSLLKLSLSVDRYSGVRRNCKTLDRRKKCNDITIALLVAFCPPCTLLASTVYCTVLGCVGREKEREIHRAPEI